MTPVILESSYTRTDPTIATLEARYLRACLRDCLMRDEAAFAPAAFYDQPDVLNDTVHDRDETIVRAGYAWWSAAERMVVYTDLGVSGNMMRAIERAPTIALPVEYRRLPSHVRAELGIE